MASFLNSSSYGIASITPTLTSKFYTLPNPSSFYPHGSDRGKLAKDALELVRCDYGDVTNAYGHVLFCFPRQQWGFDGFSEGKQVWLNGTVSGWMLSHEMGHQYGLWHAHRWAPANSSNPTDPNGKTLEYGDCFDMMGQGNKGKDYNPFEKGRLGWMPPEKIQEITQSGTYRVYRFDNPRGLEFPLLGISFTSPSGKRYQLSYRYNLVNARGGATVKWVGTFDSTLVNAYPPGGCGSQSILIPGKTILDNGLSITTVGLGGTDPDRWVDVRVNFP